MALPDAGTTTRPQLVSAFRVIETVGCKLTLAVPVLSDPCAPAKAASSDMSTIEIDRWLFCDLNIFPCPLNLATKGNQIHFILTD